MDKIKVILVDDHRIVRDGLKSLLQHEKDIEVIGGASSYTELLSLLSQEIPDVLILDIAMPEKSGIEITKIMRKDFPSIRILILTMFTDEDFVFNSLKAGASGFIPKNTSKKEFIEAIHEVYNMNEYFSDSIKNLIMKSYVKKVKNEDNSTKEYKKLLTKREEEILLHCVEGKTNQDIADFLFISTRTVESHKNHIMNKLELKTNMDLIRFAVKNNIIKL
ncbi:MAG: response regulator transcription factor [Candidatus Kapabacteria bacterium]|nr:response regulator transcription factor [Candidatus Kapabacteria bacterium]